MYKIRFLLLVTFVLSACRTVHKTTAKTTEAIQVDSSANSFKRSLNSFTTTIVNGQLVSDEFEYPPLTPAEQAKGQTEPKQRLKRHITITFNKTQSQTKTDSSVKTAVVLQKQTKKATENTVKDVKAGFPWWIIVLAVPLVAGIFLYERYGNLFSLALRIIKPKNEAGNS